MKNKLIIVFLLLFSCDWPETTVTNKVHRDGSITRTVVMKSGSRSIDPSDYRVPLDSSWTFSDTFELKDDDTIWVITASGEFTSADEINEGYKTDTGSNMILKRSIRLEKNFRWFTTTYELSEDIGRLLDADVKPEMFLKGRDLELFYHPEILTDSLLQSSDSLLYREQKANADSSEERFIYNALFEEWISGYLTLSGDSSILSNREGLLEYFRKDDLGKDSMFIYVIGEEYYRKNSSAIDSSFSIFENKLDSVFSAKNYKCEALMPGKVISTNGLADKNGKISWVVDSKYFLTTDYSMHVKSRVTNTWAWIITVAIMFGLALLIIKRRKIKNV